jgi:hypothetical protein
VPLRRAPDPRMLAVVVEASMGGVGDSQGIELQQDLVVKDEQRRSRVEDDTHGIIARSTYDIPVAEGKY